MGKHNFNKVPLKLNLFRELGKDFYIVYIQYYINYINISYRLEQIKFSQRDSTGGAAEIAMILTPSVFYRVR